jgi:hypothetical protein
MEKAMGEQIAAAEARRERASRAHCSGLSLFVFPVPYFHSVRYFLFYFLLGGLAFARRVYVQVQLGVLMYHRIQY